MQPTATHTLTVLVDETRHTLVVPHGIQSATSAARCRTVADVALTRQLNCGGRGLCATCGVWIEEGAGVPAHWHDRLAAQFGYPRLSCQITVTHDLLVRLVTDKRIWGRRDPSRRWPR